MADYPDYTRGVSIIGYTIASLPIDVSAQSIGNIAIDIAAQTLSTLNINLQSVAVTIDVDIVAQTVGNLSVDIAAQTLSNLSVDIAAQTLSNLSVDLAAQSVGNLAVDINAQTVGNLAIDISAVSHGTLGINIDSQTAAINIDTAGGANIVIDKLTQAAFCARTATLSNSVDAGTWNDYTGTNRYAKFFPRGARGFITTIQVRCMDAGASGGSITVSASPYPGMGRLYTGTITVPAGGANAWRSWSLNKMWEYDSIFLWFYTSTADIDVLICLSEPYDGWSSTDSGVTWAAVDYRPSVRVNLYGSTEGDLPVSGTLNVIQIPSQSQARIYWADSSLGTSETTLGTLYGPGRSVYLRFKVAAKTSSHSTIFRIYCDGTLVALFSFSDLDGWGYTTDSEGFAILTYAVDGECYAHCLLPFEFRREFKITAQAVATSGQDVYVEGWANLIR